MEEKAGKSLDSDTIEKAKSLLVSEPIEGLELYCTLVDNCSKDDLDEIYASVQNIANEESDITYKKSFLLCKIIENKYTTKELADSCFCQIIPMLESDNHELVDRVFKNIQYSLKGFEHEKYGLLNIYLNNTKKISVLGDFFYSFTDPKYIFDAMIRMYEVQGFRLSIDKFSNTISHLWNNDRNAVESQILNLFSHRQFGMLAVKIIASYHNAPYPVDLLKLEIKEHQLLSIDCICSYPHSIDKLLPIVLVLRNSTHKGVKEYLQTKLADLIFNGYHRALLNLVEKHISKSVDDKKFLAPLKKASADYEEMKKVKNSIQDLNPWENERNLIDLYYRLEHETQAIMMKDNRNDKSSFLSMLKNTVIVRGNAWKHEDDDIVSPLHSIQSSIMVDSRAYKNPIAYEQKLENL